MIKQKPDLAPLVHPGKIVQPDITEEEVFVPAEALNPPHPPSVYSHPRVSTTKLHPAFLTGEQQQRRMSRAIADLKQIKKNFPRAYKAMLTIAILVILGILAPLFLPVLGLPLLPALGIA